jgi:hypothetical protein
VSGMLAQMTASDLDEWAQFYKQMPDRTEWYLARLCELMANAWFRKKDKKPWRAADFQPDLRTPRERVRAQQHYAEQVAQFEAKKEEVRRQLAQQQVADSKPNGSGS